jgi:hypothetical protein
MGPSPTLAQAGAANIVKLTVASGSNLRNIGNSSVSRTWDCCYAARNCCCVTRLHLRSFACARANSLALQGTKKNVRGLRRPPMALFAAHHYTSPSFGLAG